MEMPSSGVCWLIEFIATSWKTLISSLLARPPSSLGAHLRQSNQGLCRDVGFGSRRNEPDFIQNHRFLPSSCECFAELASRRFPVVVGRCVKQPRGEPTYRHLPTPLVWKGLAVGSRLLHIYYMEILAAKNHFWDKNST